MADPAIPQSKAHGQAAHGHEQTHASVPTYLKIATVLTVITGIEVMIYYIAALRPVLVPTLLVLSATKFALVAMFYMHLKFDSRLFTGFFGSGLALAVAIVISLIAIFKGLF